MIKQPEYRKQIDDWVDQHREQMLEDLKMLVRIPSVREEPEDGMPYGPMAAKAVAAMQALMEQYGLRTRNYENYCVAGDLDGKGEKTLDILSHLDVVPVSEDWKKTQPFEPLIEGDRIYGRGTSDDKGPSIAALYAMRCIRELGLELKSGVRLVCGSDEECGSSDLEYYYGIEKEALYTISPDADYPLINVEKGRLGKAFGQKGRIEKEAGFGKVRVERIDVGTKINVIPGKGMVVLSGVTEEALEMAADRTGLPGAFSWKQSSDTFFVSVKGKFGHAAYPGDGVNCVTLILEFLKHLNLSDGAGERALLEAGRLWPHGDFRGEALHVDCSDEISGSLTMSLDLLKYEISGDGQEWSLTGAFDCRSPMCCNDSNLTDRIRERLEKAGFWMEAGTMVPPHYVSEDSELVQKLLESYELYFEKKGKPLVTGGGTYVHGLERGVAFGCAVFGVDNRMHGDDEFMEISILVKSAKILADAILRLCG